MQLTYLEMKDFLVTAFLSSVCVLETLMINNGCDIHLFSHCRAQMFHTTVNKYNGLLTEDSMKIVSLEIADVNI